MKLSVLMTAYNQDRFIAKSIESVMAQEVDFDFQLVIGEDCSTDRTREIVIEKAREHPNRIRLLLRDTNLGGRKNFLDTYDNCKGEYIAMLEGDDFWTSPDKLQTQVDLMQKHPEWSSCFHAAKEIREDDPDYSALLYPPGRKEEYSFEDLLYGNFIPTCSILFRKGLFGEWPAWIHTIPMADWPLHLLNAQHGPIGYIDEPMAVRRIHGGGVWSGAGAVANLKRKIQACEILDKHFSFQYHSAFKKVIYEQNFELAMFFEHNGNAEEAKPYARYCIRNLKTKTKFSFMTLLRLLLKLYLPGTSRYLKKLKDAF